MNILLTQVRRIGDVLMTTPAIRAIRNSYPDANIDYLTEGISEEVLRHNPYINNVIKVDKISSYSKAIKHGLKLRKNRYDIVIDFYCHPITGLMCYLTGAKRRIAMKRSGRFFFYNEQVDLSNTKPYSPYHKLELLKPINAFVDDVKLDFFISDDDRLYADNLLKELGVKKGDKLITISPVSRREYKVWPTENFAKVADYLIENYSAKILILYGPGEFYFSDNLRNQMKYQPLQDTEVFSLSKTKALLERSTLHISNDNGPCHFAIASGIDVITIFGRIDAKDWSPADRNNVFAFESDRACRKNCYYPKCDIECLRDTTPDMVIKKAEEFLLK